MIPDLDIYRSTNILVKQHGEDAAMLDEGDLDGYAVEELVRTKGERIN